MQQTSHGRRLIAHYHHNQQEQAKPLPPVHPISAIAGAVPDAPLRSRNLAIVGIGEAAGRLVLMADGDFRFLAFEASFGNWGRDDLITQDYRPTIDQIESACSAAASSTIANSRSERRELTLSCNDHWPDADSSIMTFDLACPREQHPEAWRMVELRDLPRRLIAPLHREDVETLGELAAWLAEGGSLPDLKGLKPKDAAELAAALADLWVKQTAEGGRGEQPPWMKGGSSPLGKVPEPEKRERYPDTSRGVYNSAELAAKVAEEEPLAEECEIVRIGTNPQRYVVEECRKVIRSDGAVAWTLGVRKENAEPGKATGYLNEYRRDAGGRITSYVVGSDEIFLGEAPPPKATPPATVVPEDYVFSTGEVAKICKVAPRTVSKWFDSGKLKGYKIPGSNDRRIPREQLVRFLKDNGMEVPGELQDAPAAAVPSGGLLFGPDAPTAQGGGL